MRLRGPALWLLAIVLPLAIELTVKPSRGLSIGLFAIVGVAAVALLTGAAWNSSWIWRHIADKLAPYLSGSAAVAAANDQELAAAIDDLLDELGTIHARLTDAIDASFYSYNFVLPSAAYATNRNVIGACSKEARVVLSEVYVQADALNNKMPGAISDGIAMEHVSTPDAARLREIVSRAQATLRQLRP